MSTLDELEASMSEAAKRNSRRYARVITFQMRVWSRLFPWFRHPFLHYVMSFWIGLINDGPRDLLKPRWGGITFGWLNDGYGATVWHTWRQLAHGYNDPFTGLYTDGAPRSYAEAVEREAMYKARRAAGE